MLSVATLLNLATAKVFPAMILVAAEGDAAPAGGAGIMEFLMPLLIVGVIFYFLVFRPASRERKDREAKIKSLKKHDRVVTNAGIHGTVVALDDETVTLKVDDKNNVRMRFTRAAVWQVVSGEESSDGAKSAA